MKTLVALLCGTVFGSGLALSGMTDPARVLAFLDAFGAWDPTLAFVMGSAVAVSAAGYRLARRRPKPFLGGRFELPTRRDIDPALLLGALLFGAGWGLVGLCPGPALANLYRGSAEVWLFVASMVFGMVAHRQVVRGARDRTAAASR